MRTLADRFWAKVEKRGPNECWVWTAALNPEGYGLINVAGRSDRAHRVAWKLAHGSIPRGKCVLHKCGNRACVNLHHLALGTRTEYMVETLRRRWGDPANRDKMSRHFKRLWRDPGFRRKVIRAHTRPVSERFWAYVDKNGPIVRRDLGQCWMWTGPRNTAGYGLFSVKKRIERAHRVMWAMVHGPVPRNLFVLHKCDNPPCINPDHLFKGTSRDNIQDMINKGRLVLGRRAKLLENDVKEIRAAYSTGEVTCAYLAPLYNVTPSNIHAIVTRRSWRDI